MKVIDNKDKVKVSELKGGDVLKMYDNYYILSDNLYVKNSQGDDRIVCLRMTDGLVAKLNPSRMVEKVDDCFFTAGKGETA